MARSASAIVKVKMTPIDIRILLDQAISEAVTDRHEEVAHVALNHNVVHEGLTLSTYKGVYFAHPERLLRSLDRIASELPQRLGGDDLDNPEPFRIAVQVFERFAKDAFRGIGFEEPALGFVLHTRYAAMAESLAAQVGSASKAVELGYSDEENAIAYFDDHRLPFEVFVSRRRAVWNGFFSHGSTGIIRHTHLIEHMDANRPMSEPFFDAAYHVFSPVYLSPEKRPQPTEIAPYLFDNPLVLVGIVKPDRARHRLHDIDLMIDRKDGDLVKVTAKSVEMSEWLQVAQDLLEAMRRWLRPQPSSKLA